MLHFFVATTTNLIRPDGHVIGLDLDVGALLVVRDYDGDPARTFYGTPTPIPPIPITIDQHLAMGPGGALRMVFEADAWDSTISFTPGIPVTLGGTLELTFADDVNLGTQLGRTFDLFDWTGVTPTGAFAVSSPYAWNLSNLYATGQVTLAAIPEPAAAMLLAVAFLSMIARARKRTAIGCLELAPVSGNWAEALARRLGSGRQTPPRNISDSPRGRECCIHPPASQIGQNR
jgi:hypothetical protein